MTVLKMRLARMYVRGHMTEKDYIKAAKRETDVAEEIGTLSNNKLKVKFVGYGAGVPKKFDVCAVSKKTPLDLEVNDSIFIEVQGSEKYTFATSGFFPVALDKVERAEENPTFFVFVLDNETKPNSWWIKYQKDWRNKYEIAYDFPTIYGPQDIYKTNQNDWKRGLKGLVEALLKKS